jgi:paraquat-inducible protein A
MDDLLACSCCGLAQPADGSVCRRCGFPLERGKARSLAPTAAFALAALILYIPANILPILRIEYYGAYSESTVWDGCATLFRDGQWFVAAIVFLASIAVPLFKLLGLFLLAVSVRTGYPRLRRERTWVYRILDVIGPWAMLDVFVLSVLVALVKLERIATILPGRGLLAFTLMVVCTILATASFDPKRIWEDSETR